MSEPSSTRVGHGAERVRSAARPASPAEQLQQQHDDHADDAESPAERDGLARAAPPALHADVSRLASSRYRTRRFSHRRLDDLRDDGRRT